MQHILHCWSECSIAATNGPFFSNNACLGPEAFITTSLLDVNVPLLAAGFLAGLKSRSFGIAACGPPFQEMHVAPISALSPKP